MADSIKVPHLATALEGPLHVIEKTFLEQQVKIEDWFRCQWQQTRPPFYASMDLRNAGFKLAPVDTNLFPAGFNNLNPDFMPLCVQALQATLAEICPQVTRALIIPESHSRNLLYFENISVLQEILQQAGVDARIGSVDESLKTKKTIDLPSGKKIILEPLVRRENKVGVDDFFPCFVLLNNDLSLGIPKIIQDLDQCIFPCPQFGWFKRLKSEHFRHYQQVSEELARVIDIDPWLMMPMFSRCESVDFMHKEGADILVQQAQELLEKIQKKYDEYAIKEKPFLVVKADAGTYGMAVMMVEDPQQLVDLNRKQRTRMSSAKGGRDVTQVIIQEGIHSFETVGANKAVAEPVVYMMGRHVVGGFYRVHEKRGPKENLNAPGMDFQPLAFAKPCLAPLSDVDEPVNRFYAYGVVARLALVAAARELAAFGGGCS